MAHRILIVDDEQRILESLAEFFTDRNYEVATASDGKTGLAQARRFDPDLVLLDLRLPDMDGMKVLAEIKRYNPFAGVVMITGHGDVEAAVKAIQAHADHFVLKPVDLTVLAAIVERVLVNYQRGSENVYLRQRLRSLREDRSEEEIFLPENLAEQIRILAETGAAVLILGETGTGKGVVAGLIHELDPKRTGQLIDLNCAGLQGPLLESELFGHESGAFTDAKMRKRGLFELADGGTLFLDEIAEMPPDVQAKLLKVIETKSFRRVGGTQTIHVDTRIIAATNRDLEAAVAARTFRGDLFYRLSVLPIVLPPLRERRDTIPTLARRFVDEFRKSLGRPAERISPEAESVLSVYEWPGNIRELRNVVERAVLLCQSSVITPKDLPESLRPKRGRVPINPNGETRLEVVEKAHIRWVLESANQNRSHAAELLGLNRSTLIAKIRKYGLDEDAASLPSR